MLAAAPYVISAIVLAQCGAYFLGMIRGRGDQVALRDGAACVVFAVHAAAHAISIFAGRLAPEVTDTVSAIATVALLPAWMGIGANRDARLVGLIGPTAGYAVVGSVSAALHALVELPSIDRRVVFLGRASRVDELFAFAYLGVGVGVAAAAAVLLASAQIRGTSARRHDGAVAATMALTVLLGATDLALDWKRPGWAPQVVDLGLLAVALAVLDGTILRLRDLGDELVSKRRELSTSYRELHATQARIVRNEQLAAVGELSAVIAHEVRNPLAIIKNALSGLRRRTLQPESRATLLDILDEETDKLNRLMHDLLAYARPVAPRLSAIDVEEILHSAVQRAFGGVSAPLGLEVKYQVDFAPTELVGDPDLLIHALVNVVENALQAMPNGGTLTLSTERGVVGGRESILIRVADTGEGMDTQVKERARNPFFTTRPTGTGLGLAIVERVVRNHGGQVEIDSVGGEGTTVRFSLPLDRHSLTPLPPPEAPLGGMISAGRSP